MKTLIRLFSILGIFCLTTAASCEDGTEQVKPAAEQGPVSVSIRYTVTGGTTSDQSSPLAAVAVGTGSYRSCYVSGCPAGARDLLDREGVPSGTYTKDLGKLDPATTTLYVTPWYHYPRMRPLLASSGIVVDVLVEGQVAQTVRLGYGDLNTAAYWIDNSRQSDLLNEVKLEWPR